MMPSGLDTNFHRALRALACRCGACSAATQTRNAYSMVKATSDNSSIARNSGPYCACSAGTESSIIATRLTTIRATMSRPTMTAVRSPIVPCSRISYSRLLRFAPVRQVRRSMAEFCPCYPAFSPDYAAGSTDTTLKVWDPASWPVIETYSPGTKACMPKRYPASSSSVAGIVIEHPTHMLRAARFVHQPSDLLVCTVPEPAHAAVLPELLP